MFTRIHSVIFAGCALTAGILLGAGAASAHPGGHGGASTSRACLSSAARGLLARIEQRFGAMQIVSTCRPGARVAGSGRPSRHASGNAIDFNAGGRKGEVVSWLMANHSGGVMTYPGMSHIHVDIGPRYVSLAGGARYAGGGGRARRADRSAYRSDEARPARGRYARAGARASAFAGDASGERVDWRNAAPRGAILTVGYEQ